jgi:hypothetical protein
MARISVKARIPMLLLKYTPRDDADAITRPIDDRPGSDQSPTRHTIPTVDRSA